MDVGIFDRANIRVRNRVLHRRLHKKSDGFLVLRQIVRCEREYDRMKREDEMHVEGGGGIEFLHTERKGEGQEDLFFFCMISRERRVIEVEKLVWELCIRRGKNPMNSSPLLSLSPLTIRCTLFILPSVFCIVVGGNSK